VRLNEEEWQPSNQPGKKLAHDNNKKNNGWQDYCCRTERLRGTVLLIRHQKYNREVLACL